MADKLQHLLQRRPDRADEIRGLVEVSPQFRALVARHHEVSEALQRLAADDADTAPEERTRLERQRADVEQELELAMSDHQRI